MLLECYYTLTLTQQAKEKKIEQHNRRFLRWSAMRWTKQPDSIYTKIWFVPWSAMKRWLVGAIEHLIPNMPPLRQK